MSESSNLQNIDHVAQVVIDECKMDSTILSDLDKPCEIVISEIKQTMGQLLRQQLALSNLQTALLQARAEFINESDEIKNQMDQLQKIVESEEE